MSEKADALVIFGITGDLARKMTFRALYRLERRKRLDCPIIGVGRRTDWGHENLRTRARESIEETVDGFDRDVFARLGEADAIRRRRLHGCRDLPASSARSSATPSSRSSTSRSRPRCSRPSSRARRGGPDRLGASHGREAVRARPGVGEGARRPASRGPGGGPDPAHRPLPRQGAGDGRQLPALLQHVAGAGLESPVRLPRADDDGRGLRGRGPGQLLRPGRRPARRGPEPHPPGPGSGRRWSRPPETPTDSVRDKKIDLFKAMRPADPKRYVRGQYERLPKDRGRRPEVRDRDLRRPRARDRQLALVRGPVLHPRRQVHAGQGDRGQRGLQAPAAARRRSALASATPTR